MEAFVPGGNPNSRRCTLSSENCEDLLRFKEILLTTLCPDADPH